MKLKFIILLSLLMSAASIFAQQKLRISGVVFEKATNLPVIGASVKVQGTSNGTVSDTNGEYSLNNVPANATLIITYIGMNSVEEKVNGRTKIDVYLTEGAQQLNEVVVIGYGTAKAKDLTAPIAVVKAEDIIKHASTSPMSALQGAVAGVQIINSGSPGAGPEVHIRGIGSFGIVKSDGTTEPVKPLYVVDGMFYDNINFLNNSDIQDISILKDASAAAIYGVRAANGVVIVTTRKGSLNTKPVITYDGYYGYQKATNKVKMANSEEYATMQLEKGGITDKAVLDNSVRLYGGNAATSMPSTSTDWYKEILRTAMIQNHSLDISGGNDKTAYSIGLNYLKQEGIMDVKNQYERFNIRTKADYNPYSWMKLGANIVLSDATKFDPNNSAWASAYVAPPIFPVYDDNNTAAFPVKFASPSQIGLSTYFGNPVAMAYYNDQKSQTIQILPSFYAEFYLLPKNKLKLRTAYSQDISFALGRNYTSSYYVSGSQHNTTSLLKKYTNYYRNWILDNTLTYQDSFGKHNLTALVGQSMRSDNYRNLWGQASDVPGGHEEYYYLSQGDADGATTGDAGTTYKGLSYFGRVAYNYADKYFLTATMRADGSSKYQQKWGYFPSVGVAWTMSEENFMKNQHVFDYLKLRASWGMLGNDKVQPSDGFASVTQNLGTSGVFGTGVIPGYTNLVYFSWLKWEVVHELNLGMNGTLLKNRLTIDADYYHRLTKKAVINAPLPMGAGNLLGNNGEILNSGFELSLNWQDKIGKDFTYYIGANITTLHNEVKSLNGLPYLYGGTAEFRTISKVGEQMNAYYGHKVIGVYQNAQEIANDPIAVANGLKPGDFKYQDINGDKKIDDNDRVILGSYIPSFTYGVNLGLSYKKFDFSVAMSGVSGNEIVNRKRGNRRWQSDINYDQDMVKNRWTGEGSTNKYPSAAGTINPWNISKFNSFYVEDGSYFRIQNVQAAYTFSKLMINSFEMPTIRLSLTAERPFTSFKSNGFTPEVGGIGFDDQVYPLAATYTVGLRITY